MNTSTVPLSLLHLVARLPLLLLCFLLFTPLSLLAASR